MYDINPNKYNAQKARHAISEKIKKSIDYLATECVRKLKLPPDHINPAMQVLSKMDRIFPEVHYYHHALQTAMRLQNITDTKELFSSLIQSIYKSHHQNKDFSISTINHTPWEIFSVTEAIKLAKEDCNQIAEIEPVSEMELQIAKESLQQAMDCIAQYDADMIDEIIEQVRRIKLFRGKVTMGFTDVRMLGAMFIRTPRPHLNPIFYFLEHVIHETSHIHLNCLMATDPLILNLPHERYASPLRSDPRPMIGVFHATYVSARIVRSLIKVYMATGNKDLLHPLAETLDETLRGTVEIEKNAKLTPCGSELIKSMNELITWAIRMREWKYYNFDETRPHRFGAGTTKVSVLQQIV